MANNILYCKLPTAIVSSIGTLCNIFMVVFIHLTTRLNRPMKTWVKNLGCVNALLSTMISVRTFISIFSEEQSKLTGTTRAILMSFGCFLTILQLASQLCISIERMVAVLMPFTYRSTYARSGRKLFTVAVWLASAVIGAAIGGLGEKFHIPLLMSISTWLFFTGFLITQAVLYVSIIRGLRARSRAVRADNETRTDQPSSVSNREILRGKQERKLHILAAGILISYSCCSFPLMVFVGIYELKVESQSCNSKEGLYYTVSLAFISLNMLIDPLWYFFYNYVISK